MSLISEGPLICRGDPYARNNTLGLASACGAHRDGFRRKTSGERTGSGPHLSCGSLWLALTSTASLSGAASPRLYSPRSCSSPSPRARTPRSRSRRATRQHHASQRRARDQSGDPYRHGRFRFRRVAPRRVVVTDFFVRFLCFRYERFMASSELMARHTSHVQSVGHPRSVGITAPPSRSTA